MNETDRTEAVEAQRADVPSTTNEDTVRRYALLDRLPARLADDEYVRYLAAQCDEARAERDEARDKVHETLWKGVQLEAERNTLRAELAGLKAGKWSPREVVSILAIAAWLLFIVGVFVVPAIAQAVQG